MYCKKNFVLYFPQVARWEGTGTMGRGRGEQMGTKDESTGNPRPIYILLTNRQQQFPFKHLLSGVCPYSLNRRHTSTESKNPKVSHVFSYLSLSLRFCWRLCLFLPVFPGYVSPCYITLLLTALLRAMSVRAAAQSPFC